MGATWPSDVKEGECVVTWGESQAGRLAKLESKSRLLGPQRLTD